MASKTFVDFSLPAIDAAWLNDVNTITYVDGLRVAGSVKPQFPGAGIGVVPSNWVGSEHAIDLSTTGAVWGSANGAAIGYNTYYDGSFKAKTTEVGCLVAVNSTGLVFLTAPSVTAGSAQTLSSKLAVTVDGRLYGTALHNNAGSVSGTTNQYIASGTYTPTLTNVSNVSSSSANVCQWIRVGNVVQVSGSCLVNPVGSAISQLDVSLPIASTIAGTTSLGGVGSSVSGTNTLAATIAASASQNRASCRWYDGSSGNRLFTFTFSYTVL